MPKDPKRNVDRYKIRGGALNEFEFDKNQEAFAEQKSKKDTNLIPATPPQETKQATKSRPTKTNPMRGASAKKLAARKAAKR